MKTIAESRVGEKHDRRYKLSQEMRNEIVQKYATKNYTYKQLAAEYGVTRQTIMFTINPISKDNFKKSVQKNRANKQCTLTSEQRRIIMNEHNRYKKSLIMKGEI